jgi:hypothetical protein
MHATGSSEFEIFHLDDHPDRQDYSASESFPHAQAALEDLESYGFIYKRPEVNAQPSDQFFPTHLATSLCSGDTVSLGSQSADDKRFIILETNYKIYAYTCGFHVSAGAVGQLTFSE